MVLDLFLLAAVVALGVAIAAPALGSARQREELRVVCSEARVLHDAFRRYHEKNRAYPDTVEKSGSDILEPLRRRGYYTGDITKRLMDGRVDAYDVPREQGQGPEFWVEMTLAADPSIRVLVARSDDAPLGHGRWMDGVFLLRDGKIESP